MLKVKRMYSYLYIRKGDVRRYFCIFESDKPMLIFFYLLNLKHKIIMMSTLNEL